MIAVTFALPAESSGFLRRLRKKSRTARNGVEIICGEIGDRTIEVVHTGVGHAVCQERIAAFLQNQQFKYLISAGFAGALNDGLHVGDLLLAENFSTVGQSEARSALSTLPVQAADLLTVPSMIDSAEERKRIAQATGADAADMETEFIARRCAEHGVPLVSLRVISDTPSEPFPAPSKVLFDIKRQRTSMLRLTIFFLARPSRIPHLIRFGRRIARARKVLARALVEMIRALA